MFVRVGRSHNDRIPLNGSLGMFGGKMVAPTDTQHTAMVKTIEGPTIGVTGFMFATEIRYSLGFGVPIASTGYFVKLPSS